MRKAKLLVLALSLFSIGAVPGAGHADIPTVTIVEGTTAPLYDDARLYLKAQFVHGSPDPTGIDAVPTFLTCQAAWVETTLPLTLAGETNVFCRAETSTGDWRTATATLLGSAVNAENTGPALWWRGGNSLQVCVSGWGKPFGFMDVYFAPEFCKTVSF